MKGITDAPIGTFRNMNAATKWIRKHAGPGRMFHMLLVHQNGCSQSRCTCSPEVEIRKLTTETYLEGAELEKSWIKETSS